MKNRTKPNKCNVSCEWLQTGRILVNPDGQVWPCCYLANAVYMTMNLTDSNPTDEISNQVGDRILITSRIKNEPILVEYMKNKNKYNIFHAPFEEILAGEWFVKTLPESWDDENLITLQCAEVCGTGEHRVRK